MNSEFNSGRFKSERKRKNLSQRTLADLANTSERYLRDLEKGNKTNPSAELVFRFSKALKVPMEDLMTEMEGES